MLIFLLLFLNVKIIIKVIAILLIYLLRPPKKIRISAKSPGLPLFYPLIIIIAALNWALLKGFQDMSYSITVATGISFWLLCILAFRQIKLSVQLNDAGVIENTLATFFLVNALVACWQYGMIAWETGVLNPYQYQADFQKYFIRTGDYIKGISFDTSTANGAMNAFAVLYFLQRQRYMMTMVCMLMLLMTGANYTNLMLLLLLTGIFIFKSSREKKAIIISCVLLFIVFLAKVSPQNNKYITEAFNYLLFQQKPVVPPFIRPVRITERPDSSLSAAEKKEKVATIYLDSIYKAHLPKQAAVTTASLVIKIEEKIDLPKDDIHSRSFQSSSDTTVFQQSLFAFIGDHRDKLQYARHSYVDPGSPGKLIALKQTVRYFQEHPSKFFLGAGTGNFSSRLAFRATGLQIAGNYPARFRYIHQDFLSNHLDLYLYFFSNNIKLHSLSNTPDAVYMQLLSEYGITGFMVFFLFYLGYFLRKKKYWSVTMPFIALLLGLFLTEYWFEQLSIVIIFELMVLSNQKTSDVLLHAKQI